MGGNPSQMSVDVLFLITAHIHKAEHKYFARSTVPQRYT